MLSESGLSEAIACALRRLAGQMRGRTVADARR